MPHRVFISYAQRDRNAAGAVVAHLEQSGVACWIAPRDIVSGASWPLSIVAAIDTSELFVLVFSAHSNASDDVRREVELAIKRGITVVPLRIDDCVPEGELEYFLSSAHWMDAISPPIERHLDQLASRVRTGLQMPVDPGDPISSAQPSAMASTVAAMRRRNRVEEERPPKIGRNNPCPCGSGKKYKKCHGAKDYVDDGALFTSRAARRPPGGGAAQDARREASGWRGQFDKGEALRVRNEHAEALEAYRSGLELAEAEAARDTENLFIRSALSILHGRISGVLQQQGDLASAMQSRKESLRVSTNLVQRDATNPKWLRGLFVERWRAGDLHRLRGESEPALEMYRAALDRAREVAHQTTDSVDALRELLQLQAQIADLLWDTEQLTEGLVAYREALPTADRISELEPGEESWVTYRWHARYRIAQLLEKQGDFGASLAAYRTTLLVSESARAKIEDNTTWRLRWCDVSEKIANALQLREDAEGALRVRRDVLRLRDALAAAYPDNADYQQALLRSLFLQAVLLQILDRDDEAEQHGERALRIFDELRTSGVKLDPNLTQFLEMIQNA